MFEELKRLIKDIESKNRISIPIGVDNEGYLDRECSNEDCLFQFKINQDDWDKLSKNDVAFCPLCRHEAESESWHSKEQLDEGLEQGKKYYQGLIDSALIKGAKDFNSKQSNNGFVKISVKVSGTKPLHYIMPISSKEEMQLKIQCKICNTRYAIIGSAFFCPCCGHNSAEETFDNSMKKIQDKIKNIPLIRKAVETINKDEAETTCRSIIETSLGECVVAFQRFCEVTYLKKAPNKSVKFNAFQNIEFGAKYWKDLFGESYEEWLNNNELARVKLLFQKRHLLAHTEGIVDQKYIDKANDGSYKVGQRIVIKEKDVSDLVNLIKILTGKLKEK